MPLFRRSRRPNRQDRDKDKPDQPAKRPTRRADRQEGRLEKKRLRGTTLKWLFFCLAAAAVLVVIFKFF